NQHDDQRDHAQRTAAERPHATPEFLQPCVEVRTRVALSRSPWLAAAGLTRFFTGFLPGHLGKASGGGKVRRTTQTTYSMRSSLTAASSDHTARRNPPRSRAPPRPSLA